MAYSFIKNKKGGVSVLLDSAADISLVPVDKFFPGTFAFTADGSAHYRLSTSRSWVEVAGGVTPGGGLPEVTGSGKALVSVNGEWTMQDGYGYTEGELVTIEWDGVTEGKTKAQEDVGYDLYKVSDIVVVDKETIIGGVFFSDSGQSFLITDEIVDVQESVISVADYVVFVSEDNVESTIGTFPEKGVYFGTPSSFYVSKVQYGATVHKIDSKYLPEVGNDIFKITFSPTPVPGTMPPEHTADKSAAEMIAATVSGKLLLANTGTGTMPVYFDPKSGLQCISTSYRLDGDGFGELHVFGYTFDMSSETWKYFTDVFSQPD